MTTKAFVIGHPIAHSRSPLIHGTWLKSHGIDGSYTAFDVEPAGLSAFFERIRAGEFAGGNVTIPHKQAVFGLCDEVDALAERIGAVNTVVRRGAKLHGSNTDYMGFLGNLDQNAPGWSDGQPVAVVLGAGGAARAILVALGSRNIPVILLNRTRETADRLAHELGGEITTGTLADFAMAAPLAGLLVNTTSVGMHGTRFDNLDLSLLRAETLVTDIVYTPLVTPLLADAQARGLQVVDGLGMLLHQAVPGFAAWFGVTPEVTPDLRATIAATL
jgi:shikimate dehydrogenase